MLPDDSPWLGLSFQMAIDTVNPAIALVPGSSYTVAAYNLASDILVNWAGDVSPPTPWPGDGSADFNPKKLGYFAYLRDEWNINGFVAGVIQSSADESTSESMVVPEAFKDLMIGDLQNLKTPWGRAYLAIAQKVGTAWGLS